MKHYSNGSCGSTHSARVTTAVVEHTDQNSFTSPSWNQGGSARSLGIGSWFAMAVVNSHSWRIPFPWFTFRRGASLHIPWNGKWRLWKERRVSRKNDRDHLGAHLYLFQNAFERVVECKLQRGNDMSWIQFYTHKIQKESLKNNQSSAQGVHSQFAHSVAKQFDLILHSGTDVAVSR